MIKFITSTSNPEIKKIRGLREKKKRDETGLFFVEGIRLVIEAYKKNTEIDRIIYSSELLRSQPALSIIQQISRENPDLLLQVDAKVFAYLAQKEGPQGLAAVIHQSWGDLDGLTDTKEGIWVGLDTVQDPGNLGSILRTLDAVGGKGVILLDRSTDVYHPTAVRASTGALFSLKIIRASQKEFLEWKKDKHIPCFGAVCQKSSDYQNIIYPANLVILMGSEQKGLNPTLIEMCDTLIHIPMSGSVDSLNLANAASVILYEVYNQHRNKEIV